MAEIKKKQKEKQTVNFYQQMPFNFCDRWCERCSLTDNCQIFKQAFNDRLKHIFQGEDPDDPAVVFSDIKKTFSRLIKTIKDDIKKQGIDSKKVKIKIIKTGLNQNPQPESFILWRTAHRLVLQISNLLNNVFSEENEEFQEISRQFKNEFEELNWYYVFFEGKLYQALAVEWSFKKEKNKILKKFYKQEIDTAAELSFRALKSCQKILEKISPHLPGYISWSKDLSISAGLILEKIETKFPNCHQKKIIFHSQY
ncbi:MAG: hypothetical protein PHW15_00355 [Patescibacteria group bacterium]|jgi:hypothetical protein|nr:hypothetical protein [Patescibacteria group bacterium]MDD5173173.1 hypothetical protein [Patescibacteria group bacterium]